MQILKKEMKLKGLTIKRFAALVGITTANVHGWFNGDYKPSPSKIKILKDLGFSDIACLCGSKFFMDSGFCAGVSVILFPQRAMSTMILSLTL